MNLKETRIELSITGKNGIGFLLSGMVIWTIITAIFLLPIGVYEKSIFMLFSTGLMFPLSVALSRMIKADWKMEGNPLGSLGIYLNLAQIMYFPILIWAIGNHQRRLLSFLQLLQVHTFSPMDGFIMLNLIIF